MSDSNQPPGGNLPPPPGGTPPPASPPGGNLPPPASGNPPPASPPGGNLPPPPGGTPPAAPPPGAPAQWGPPQAAAVAIPGGHNLADPWLRIAARFIDGLIIGAVNLILILPLIDDGGFGTGFSSSFNLGYLLLSLLIGASYEIGFVGALGGTPGKLLLGLRVVSQETGETPPGWDKAGLRYLPSLVGLVPILGGLASLAIVIASLVWLFSDDYRRTVYDRVAITYVVKV